MFIPWLAKVAPTLSGYKNILRNVETVLGFLGKHLDAHRANFVEGQPRDFVDAYFQEIKNTSDPDSSFYQERGCEKYIIHYFSKP